MVGVLSAAAIVEAARARQKRRARTARREAGEIRLDVALRCGDMKEARRAAQQIADNSDDE